MDGAGHQQNPQDQPVDQEMGRAILAPCIDRMPGPIVQASTGGTSPGTSYETSKTNITQIEVQSLEMGTERDTPVWVRGSSEEDIKRYKGLMDYMEEKRVEARELLREENERKERAKEKENSWALLRLSMAYLKKHEEGQETEGM